MPESHREPPPNLAAEATRSGAALRAKLAQQSEAPDGRPPEPATIPDHTLLRCIGRGACGEVWLARNALGTLRAVKIVYRARFNDDRPYEREFNGILKYEPVSRTHEGLVHVLHVGRSEEIRCFYYVMELADAEDETQGIKSEIGQSTTSPFSEIDVASYRPRTLRSELTRSPRLTPTAAAQVALRIAKALGHLHDQGLV